MKMIKIFNLLLLHVFLLKGFKSGQVCRRTYKSKSLEREDDLCKADHTFSLSLHKSK